MNALQESAIGTLYVVATPIGNLEDIGLRALRVLDEVGLVAAEDTRVTRKLLARHGLNTPLTSFHAHSRPEKRAALVERLTAGDIALVTDAGTPGISDPGAALVRDARALGHTVVAIPGPSAVAAALSVSGFSADNYMFLGYLPRRAAERRRALEEVAAVRMTVVVFEAPHRFQAALADLLAAFGDREICVARELTKRFEECWTGRISDAVERWTAEPPKGEFTLVIAGAKAPETDVWDDEAVIRSLDRLRAEGISARVASRELAAESSRPAREIYDLWHRAPSDAGTGDEVGSDGGERC